MTAERQTDQKHVKIKYKPREQFRSFHNRKQRWSALVCHRRAGKTVATLNDLIRGAVNECKPEGRYARYQRGFRVTLHEDLIELPLSWRKPRTVFVNSMSDLFHGVPLAFIRKVFATMHACGQHTSQVLTKRSERLVELSSALPWPPNVWIGVSVEDSKVLHRVRDLAKVPAALRFLSCEPLIGPLDDLPLAGIHWVIVGGESGPHARPMQAEWVEPILAQCRRADVKFFFKQWGGVRKDITGRLLHGRTYDDMPARRALSALSSQDAAL